MTTQTTQTIKVRHKGQITLPADIRERLRLAEGDVLSVHEEDGRIVLENPLEKLRRVLETSTKYFTTRPPLEPEEIRRLTAESITQSAAEKLARIEQDRLED